MKYLLHGIYNVDMAPPTITMLGQSFGKWTVLGKDESHCSKNTHWLCRCECGFEKSVDGSHLRKGHSLSCRKCSEEKPKDRLNSKYWHHLKHSAKIRDIDFDLSKEYLWSLFCKQNKKCALSGIDLTMATTLKKHMKGGTTASVDRIDSSKGYIEGNVQWVHKSINKMKMDLDQQTFIALCEMVTKRFTR